MSAMLTDTSTGTTVAINTGEACVALVGSIRLIQMFSTIRPSQPPNW